VASGIGRSFVLVTQAPARREHRKSRQTLTSSRVGMATCKTVRDPNREQALTDLLRHGAEIGSACAFQDDLRLSRSVRDPNWNSCAVFEFRTGTGRLQCAFRTGRVRLSNRDFFRGGSARALRLLLAAALLLQFLNTRLQPGLGRFNRLVLEKLIRRIHGFDPVAGNVVDRLVSEAVESRHSRALSQPAIHGHRDKADSAELILLTFLQEKPLNAIING
jgi:hypothetical protein